MASTEIASNTRNSTDLLIESGPGLVQFLDAALKGGSGIVEFEARSGRNPRANIVSITSTVEIHKTECEDDSGALFLIEGLLRSHRVRGLYNAQNRTGWLNYR